MAIQVLTSNAAINFAVKFATPFRIHPGFANLAIEEAGASLLESARCYEVIADALKYSSQGLKSVSMKLLNPRALNTKKLERAVISIIDALKANVNLIDVKLQIDFITDDIIEAIGRFLKECTSIKTVDLSHLPILNQYLYCGMIAEGLAGCKNLEKLDLGEEPNDENKPHRFEDNLNILTEALMQNNSVASHFWEDSWKRILIIKRKPEGIQVASKLNTNVNTNAEEKEYCLYRKITVAQRTIEKRKQELASNAEEYTKLGKSIEDLKRQHQSLETEWTQLQAKINILDIKRGDVASNIKNNTSKFNQMKIERDKMSTEVQKLQKFVTTNQPELEKWKQKLQGDLRMWTVDDVLFFLTEIEQSRHRPKFKQNNIDGTLLLALDANDLMTMLGIPYKDAKTISMYKYMAQVMHDIYVPPQGPFRWTNEEVLTWLNQHQLSHLKGIFTTHQITGMELLFLEKSDLTNHLNIKAIGDVMKLHGEISKLKDTIKDDRMVVDEGSNNNQMNIKQVPPAFICPITHEMMTDPVVASDGHTYERTAIELWLKTKYTSPMTGLQLANKQLTPSHTLKSMIREFVENNKK